MYNVELFGEDGNDILIGSGNAHILDSGAGDNTLEGLSNNDILTEGPGADIFRYYEI